MQFPKDLSLDPDSKGILVLSIYPYRIPCRQQELCMQTVERQWRGKARGTSEKWAVMQMVPAPVHQVHGHKMSTELLTWALLTPIKSLHRSSVIGASCGMLLSWRICFIVLNSLSFLPWRTLISILNGLVLSGAERSPAHPGTVTILTGNMLQVEWGAVSDVPNWKRPPRRLEASRQ